MTVALATRPREADHREAPALRPAPPSSAPQRQETRSSDQVFKTELLALIPQVKTFARMLAKGREDAEDLTQDTLARAWRHRDAFQPGTNLRAWLFTIARNAFLSKNRRAWREGPLDEDSLDHLTTNGADQVWSTELTDTLRAMRSLPDVLREALLLVGAKGYSYEEVAVLCDCPIGTIKSRVSRARTTLAALLEQAPGGSTAQFAQASPT